MTAQWHEKQVFLTAIQLPESEREQYLRTACPDEASLERVKRLIRAHQKTESAFLERHPSSVTEPDNAFESRQYDEFRILRQIGIGGMGAVYLANDEILGRVVALKVLSRHVTNPGKARTRFEDEARLAASLRHPNIVTVYKFGEIDGDCYIASEYVDGPTLRQLIEQRRSAAGDSKSRGHDAREWRRDVARYVASIGEALHTAHAARIVHRDVKPSNILIDSMVGARLTDFGIAKRLIESDLEQRTEVVGSCHYMSPEQASIEQSNIDERSDVFSLGVTLYEALTLRRPFDGATVHEVLHSIQTSEALRLRTIEPSIDRDLETICHKAIEKRPVDRYQTASHFSADLQCYLTGQPILAKPPSAIRKVQRTLYKRRTFLAIGGASAAGALLGVWFYKQSRTDLRPLLDTSALDPNTVISISYVDLDKGLAGAFQRLGPASKGLYPVAPGYLRIQLAHSENKISELTRLVIEDGQHFSIVNDPSQDKPTQDMTQDMIQIEHGGHTRNPGRGAYQRRVSELDSFWIDRHEVTNGEFEQFLNSTASRASSYRAPLTPEIEQWISQNQKRWLDLPAVGVNFYEAQAYAEWAGKRLPTELEWLRAARGPDALPFPWGHDKYDPTMHSLNVVTTPSQQMGGWTPAWSDGAFKLYTDGVWPQAHTGDDSGPHGLVHMASNVLEWTETIPGPGALNQRQVMGNMWTMTARPFTDHGLSVEADTRRIGIGFRCALSARPTGENR